MESPVKYAKSGDVHIAYRIFGDGPLDIVLVPGTLSHVELYWELPANEYLLKRLTSFAACNRFRQARPRTLGSIRGNDSGRKGRRCAGSYGCGRLETRCRIWLVRRRPDVSDVCRDLPGKNLRPRPVRLLSIYEGGPLGCHQRAIREIPCHSSKTLGSRHPGQNQCAQSGQGCSLRPVDWPTRASRSESKRHPCPDAG